MPSDTKSLFGPKWDLSTEYASPTDPLIEKELGAVDEFIDTLAQLTAPLAESLPRLDELSGELTHDALAQDLIRTAQRAHTTGREASIILRNLQTFANCVLSVSGQDDDALALQGKLQRYDTRLSEAYQPLKQFVNAASDALIDAYLASPDTAPSAFVIRHQRERRSEMLSLDEENLIAGLGTDGITAWGRLYTQLSSSLECQVPVGNDTQAMGLASAAGLMQTPDDNQRRAAWTAINEAWSGHDETCAAALNALSGWRLTLYDKRGTAGKAIPFLTPPAHQNRISTGTLDTLMAAAKGARDVGRRAARTQALAYGKSAYGPWDNRAPPPATLNAGASGSPGIPYSQAIEIIASAYRLVAPEMGDFVEMMDERGWIEGSVGDAKRPGAYCTNFAKSRTPRVYMTYSGGESDVITLAHELGHAYHGWVMRDLDEAERSYGMSLAETASTFGETITRAALSEAATTDAQAFAIQWQDAEAAVAFLLNIPARFQFESELYERRAIAPLRPNELREIMSRAWTDWYGDALSEPDPMFWASKLHFFISGLSFYNFPYLFGYLFSLGVYAQRETLGDDFFPAYKALLRDTGRMTAEDLAKKHLDVDLTEPHFWEQSIAIAERSVARFEDLASRVVTH